MFEKSLISWIRKQQTPSSRTVYKIAKSLLLFQSPFIPLLHIPLYRFHLFVRGFILGGLSRLYWTPVFRARLQGTHRKLRLAGVGFPMVTGPVELTVGDNCRLSSAITVSGRTSSLTPPTLQLGNNVGIGWQSTIAVGSTIVLKDNVRIGGGAFLAGYPGHPLDASDRAAGLADRDEQVGDIILEQDVWLGTRVMVMAGVSIGAGTIVASGSVVTKSLPSCVIAAGVPAQIVRKLPSSVDPLRDDNIRQFGGQS
ncbi:MAG: acyltransferase [Sneathiella sp.]